MFDCQQVLEFWFGNEPDVNETIGRQSALWWSKDEATDEALRRRFETDLQALLAADAVQQGYTAEQRLAAIILADQVTRSIYRDTPAAFSGDDLALSLCLDGLAGEQDRSLTPLQRVFFYMPLEHAESLQLQDRSVRLFESLLEEVGPELQKSFQSYLDFARRHRDIIARFGRFPHRNRILGRESTQAELDFLQEPGSGF